MALASMVIPECGRSRALLDLQKAENMLNWEHGGGLSLDASGRIEATDHVGLERLQTRRGRWGILWYRSHAPSLKPTSVNASSNGG